MILAVRLSAADRCEWEEPPGAGVAFLCPLMRFLASSFISNHLRFLGGSLNRGDWRS